MDVSLSIDSDGDACLRLELPRSKNDQYNEGHVKRLKGTNRPLCPVRSLGRWVGIQPETILALILRRLAVIYANPSRAR